MAPKYSVDGFNFFDSTPYALACGRLYSALQDDIYSLTAYGNYVRNGACLIKWKPRA